MKKLMIAVALICAATSVQAVTLEGTHAVCASEEFLDQLISAAVAKSDLRVRAAMKRGCVKLPGGTDVEVVDLGFWSGVAHVRVFVNGAPVDIWTPMENLKR